MPFVNSQNTPTNSKGYIVSKNRFEHLYTDTNKTQIWYGDFN